MKMSHPTRGAWIETGHPFKLGQEQCGRTPPGVRGLKHLMKNGIIVRFSRTPPGVRGLKHR